MASKASTRNMPARKTTTRKARASASSPAAVPITEHKPKARNDHDRAHSKSHPSCYCCFKRAVRCSNTDSMTGFPCTACLRRGTTADCIAHKDHPDWVPGVTAATHKRKRRVKRLEKDTANDAKDGNNEKPKKKQKGSQRKAGDVEVVPSADGQVPATTKSSKRKPDALEPNNEDKTIDEFAAPAAPLPDTGSPRRSLRNNVTHVANVNDGDEVQSEGGKSEDGVAPAGETPEETEAVEKVKAHANQLPDATIKPDACKLSTVQEIEFSLGDAADRPEVGLVLEQMHSRYASGSGEVPHRMHLLFARVVRHCQEAGISTPSD